jgi:multiple sugar transport system permease protein
MRRTNSIIKFVVIYCGVLLTLSFVLLPLLWMVIASTQPEINIVTIPQEVDLRESHSHYYAAMLRDPSFLAALRTSIIVALGTMMVCLVLGSLASYPLARLHMPHKSKFMVGILATRMLPRMILVLPMFLFIRQLGLLDTYWALLIVNIAFILPYVIWMLKTFFEDIPRALESAARMDGCTRLGALFRIILPVSAPGVAATGIFVFLTTWNEFLFAFVLTSKNAKTVIVKLAEIQSSPTIEGAVGQMAAGMVLAVAPVVLIVIVLNQFIVRGLTEGAVKG